MKLQLENIQKSFTIRKSLKTSHSSSKRERSMLCWVETVQERPHYSTSLRMRSKKTAEM